MARVITPEALRKNGVEQSKEDLSKIKVDPGYVRFFTYATEGFTPEARKEAFDNNPDHGKAYRDLVAPWVEGVTDIMLPVLREGLRQDSLPTQKELEEILYTVAGQKYREVYGNKTLEEWKKKVDEVHALHFGKVGQLERQLPEEAIQAEMAEYERDPVAYDKVKELQSNVYNTLEELAQKSWLAQLGAFQSWGITRAVGNMFRSKEENRALEATYTPIDATTKYGDYGFGHTSKDSKEAILAQGKIISEMQDVVTLRRLRADVINHSLEVSGLYKIISERLNSVVAQELEKAVTTSDLQHTLRAKQEVVDIRTQVLRLKNKRGVFATAGRKDKNDSLVEARTEAVAEQERHIREVEQQMEAHIKEHFDSQLNKYYVHERYTGTHIRRDKEGNTVLPGRAPEIEIPRMLDRFEKMDRLGTKDKKEIWNMLSKICKEKAASLPTEKRDYEDKGNEVHSMNIDLQVATLLAMAEEYKKGAESFSQEQSQKKKK